MSAAELTVARRRHVLSTRFLRSELRLVFGRRRNVLLLAVVALFPILIGIGLRLASHPRDGGGGGGLSFVSELTGNGIFLSFIALTVLQFRYVEKKVSY